MLQSLTEAMKLVPSLFLFSLVLGVNSQNWFQSTVDFLNQACLGVADMWRAYQHMREANYKNSDKYFQYYDAAWRGPGGAWIAEVIRYEFLNGSENGAYLTCLGSLRSFKS
uniref:Serum amyloid A protein n=1 Tax=Sarcophilus harrisii TaxID=9305 RepID=A0A7N4NSF1_SARHA